MKSCSEWIDELLGGKTLVSGALTSPVLAKGVPDSVRKVAIKPVFLKGETVFQFTSFIGQKVIHKNLASELAVFELNQLIGQSFRQAIFHSATAEIYVRVDKVGAQLVSVKSKKNIAPQALVLEQHDRPKSRILPEGEPVDFLIRLGVMTTEGRVIAAKFDKFKQINRFLELAADAVEQIKPGGTLNIIDFGSGKSYLTFALYYYFTATLKRDVKIVGLDMKQDVVVLCNSIAADLQYDNLKFQVGDIAGYTGASADTEVVDMVVSLHACDTATDDALRKAVEWNSQVILAVPCCQHELFSQLKSEASSQAQKPILKHGILKERMAAIITDALRAQWLEAQGYNVQVMEFIETAHTPKNLLIRAVARGTSESSTAMAEFDTLCEYWGVSPAIGGLAE